MGADLELARIPLVLDPQEVPFVLGFRQDARRCLVAGGAEYRRASDRVAIDWRLGDLRLRALLLNGDGVSYLVACPGPLLEDWWPLLRKEGGNPARPLLSAAVVGAAQRFETSDLTVDVSTVPASDTFNMTLAVAGIAREPAISEESLLLAHLLSLGVIKAALHLLMEYRLLVDPVPDMQVETGGIQRPLQVVLDTAATCAGAITWRHVPA